MAGRVTVGGVLSVTQRGAMQVGVDKYHVSAVNPGTAADRPVGDSSRPELYSGNSGKAQPPFALALCRRCAHMGAPAPARLLSLRHCLFVLCILDLKQQSRCMLLLSCSACLDLTANVQKRDCCSPSNSFSGTLPR